MRDYDDDIAVKAAREPLHEIVAVQGKQIRELQQEYQDMSERLTRLAAVVERELGV